MVVCSLTPFPTPLQPIAHRFTGERKTMKKIQKLCAAAMLLLVLTGSVLAGHITTDAVPPPPPPPASAMVAETDKTTTDGMQTVAESESVLTEIALSLLQFLSVI